MPRSCLLLLFPLVSLAVDPIARTSFGSIRGYQRTARNGEVVNVFKSVPFAAPPIGELRWKLPRDPAKWEGIIDGTQYSAACPSNHTKTTSQAKTMSEDCLYLNVFVLANCKGDCPITAMFHGGAMTFDSAVYYNDDYLIDNFASKGMMLVVPAFRLGVLGIFDLGDGEESIPSNLGAHDALQALNFLSREAVAFGGDAESITLFGHSYGGTLVGALAYTPLRKIKINRFVMMSPSLEFDHSSDLRQWLTSRLVAKAGCSEGSIGDKLACLRAKDAMELLRYQSEMAIEDESSDFEISFEFLLMDSPLLPFANFSEMFKHPPGVDVVIGSTAREKDIPRRQLQRAHPGDLVDARNLVELEKIRGALVTSNNGTAPYPVTEIIFMSVHQVARSVIDGGNKAFVYSYQQDSPHTLHTDDFSFLVGIHQFEHDENEKEVAKFYPELFVNFTLFGTPSPDWAPMNDSDSYFSVAVDLKSGRRDIAATSPEKNQSFRRPTMMDGYEKDAVDYWTKVAPRFDTVISEAKSGKVSNGEFFNEMIKTRSVSTAEVVGQSTSGSSTIPLMTIGAVAALFLVAVWVKPRRINQESIGLINRSDVSLS